jgi:nucleoside recognition membrane protein YjiH
MKTRFVICILSLVQIIYMTEVGSIMLNSKLPITIMDLAIIFLEKTIIAIPMIVFFTDLFVKFQE